MALPPDLVRRPPFDAVALLPGVALCGLIAVAAVLLQHVETRFMGREWLEALVLAILLGAAIRTAWTPGRRWVGGIVFSGKTLLEIAVVLMGAAISARTILDVGPALLFGIFGVVVVGLTASYAIGRLCGLPRRMAALIACGNSICGNSAIAAVAPVIGADSRDVATSIAFTAVLGVGVVLGLPLLAVALGLSPQGFGVFAGLTVYAVPQVLAATAPISSVSSQVGTLVKLVRVLMLGPVVLMLSLIAGRFDDQPGGAAPVRRRPPLHQLVPWFIVGFLALIAFRSAGLIPQVVLEPAAQTARWLTIISMAALGLGVDVRVVARAGARVTSVVVLSLVVLGAVALALIAAVGLW